MKIIITRDSVINTKNSIQYKDSVQFKNSGPIKDDFIIVASWFEVQTPILELFTYSNKLVDNKLYQEIK